MYADLYAKWPLNLSDINKIFVPRNYLFIKCLPSKQLDHELSKNGHAYCCIVTGQRQLVRDVKQKDLILVSITVGTWDKRIFDRFISLKR
jgi:hypothetical protein